MTMPPTVAAYLRSLLSLDERITSASLVVQHSTTDARPDAYGVARFCNGLVWSSSGVAGISSLYGADEIAPAEDGLWEDLDGACSTDAVNVLRSLPEAHKDGDAWTLYRDEVRAL